MAIVIDRHRRVGAPRAGDQGTEPSRTLGDVLHVSKAKAHVFEKDWVRLVQSIAAGDQLARNALEVLTPEERQAIETAFFSELTYHEVATKLNQPLGTVQTRIRSGLGNIVLVHGAFVDGSGWKSVYDMPDLVIALFSSQPGASLVKLLGLTHSFGI
jgi:Sigma-70, region 4